MIIDEVDLIDHIILTQPLAEIDKTIRLADFQLSLSPEPAVENYWLEVKYQYVRARNIAEYCFDNNIPTCEWVGRAVKKPPADYRVIEILGAVRDVETRLAGVESYTQKNIPPLKKKVDELSQRKPKIKGGYRYK